MKWRVYLEGIALGALVLEAESEEAAIAAAGEDGDLDVLVSTYDVRAVSAVMLEEDGGEVVEVA